MANPRHPHGFGWGGPLLFLLALLSAACSGAIGGADEAGQPGGSAGQAATRRGETATAGAGNVAAAGAGDVAGGAAGNAAAAGGPAGGAAGLGGGGAGSNAGGEGAGPPAATSLIPARIRRLTNTEYNASVSALLGMELAPAEAFAPDARQDGFTENEAQRVDPVLGKQLFSAAEQLARDARPRLVARFPCDTPDEPEPCAREFIATFGGEAYRRPLTDDEAAGLLEVFRVGAQDGDLAADGGRYGAALELVTRALLQSPGFVYVTELGDSDGTPAERVALDPLELASALSYLVTGGPPDEALREAAAEGRLDTADGREAELRRLHASERSLTQQTKLIREWLELDRVDGTAKDSTVYPAFDGLKDAIVAESRDFVRAVLDPTSNDASSDVEELFGAAWTVAEPGIQTLYSGATQLDAGRLSLPERRGVLNQGAFLSVQAHAHESAPVLRGVLVARRVACLNIPSPSALNIDVVPPVPDPSQTTRQRFTVHTADPQCAQCHRIIDGFGNAFEQYDGMGAYRDVENGLPVDATTTVEAGTDVDGDYSDSNALSLALSQSPEVRECFARHVFRAAAARSGASAAEQEDAFIAAWRELPEVERGNLIDMLAVFVRSELFAYRTVPP